MNRQERLIVSCIMHALAGSGPLPGRAGKENIGMVGPDSLEFSPMSNQPNQSQRHQPEKHPCFMLRATTLGPRSRFPK